LATDTQATSEDEQKEIEIKNILVPIDGSEYSLQAAKYATRIARNEKAQLFCIHVVTAQQFKFFHRHASSPSPSSDYTKQEPREEQRLISYESLPVYDSESNQFVGEVEIPVELQLMSQVLHNRMSAELPLEIVLVQHRSQYRHKYQCVTCVITRWRATT